MTKRVLLWVSVVLAVSAAQAIEIELVPVGNPGNAADDQVMDDGTSGYGAVDYAFQIGKYEVTAEQYSAFLNDVAKTDPYGLYNPRMWSDVWSGGRIHRSGEEGDYSYTVAPGSENQPVSYVGWGDAARFANWLHNGRPTGPQDATTTEEGAYSLNGATTAEALMGVTRNPNAIWWLPSEDEWYKAAYHANDGATGNYWDYPTGTNSTPSNKLIEPDPGNNANFSQGGTTTIADPFPTTLVGEFENSGSPYGTFDQGGNLWEWNDSAIDDSSRGVRGGNWGTGADSMRAFFRGYAEPTIEGFGIGFRVATIPEPGAAVLLFCVVAVGLVYRQRRR